ncbi:MAG: DUF4292 domain-containing protein [Deltaproteobacteria bacterium]|nr:DUF4292 domain-containing protein [Deltaproteobacteria bacterium]
MSRKARTTASNVKITAFALALLFSASCTLTPRPSSPAPAPPPSASTLPTGQELLQSLTDRRTRTTSLRGLARIAYKDTAEKGTARQAVAVMAPDHFRLELFSPVGIAALVTTNGQQLAAYLPQEKMVYRGAATPRNAARFLRIMLSAGQVTSLLLGLPLLPLDVDGGSMRLDPESRHYELTVPIPGGGTQRFMCEQKTRRLLRWEVRDKAELLLARMSLADYRAVQGQDFPFEIALVDLQGNQEATIYYEQLELNPTLPPTLFTLSPIAGVQETNLDATP